MKSTKEKHKPLRCKVCKNKIFTWGVSGIEAFFLKRKISLTFEDFVMCDGCADKLRKVIKSSNDLKNLLQQAYLAGFNASGEGYNGEYPFRDKDQRPDDDADWCQKRDEELKELLEETNG